MYIVPLYTLVITKQSTEKLFQSNKFLPSATKLRRLCFYRRVSVHRGGVPDQVLPPDQVHPSPLGPGTPPGTRYTPRGRYTPPQAGTPPGPGTPPGRYTRPNSPPPPDTATAADGTHPTGIHSCFVIVFDLFRFAFI